MNKELKDKLKEIISFHCSASKRNATKCNFPIIEASPKIIKLVEETIDMLEENLLAEIDII